MLNEEISTVELGHSSHVKRAEPRHNPSPVIFVLPHLRVLLGNAVTQNRCFPILGKIARLIVSFFLATWCLVDQKSFLFAHP